MAEEKKNNKKDFFRLESEVIRALKEVYDPEIPINVYDLGLIYRLDIDDDNNVEIDMTLTAPNCPIADQIVDYVRERLTQIEDVNKVVINLVFDPPWSPEMMSEEAKLQLGYM